MQIKPPSITRPNLIANMISSVYWKLKSWPSTIIPPLYLATSSMVKISPIITTPEKDGGFSKTLYKLTPAKEGDEPSEFSIMIFGEICLSSFGTTISAKGNHYSGTAENPKVSS